MSYEKCFGGFAGHNVDRRLWVMGWTPPDGICVPR